MSTIFSLKQISSLHIFENKTETQLSCKLTTQKWRAKRKKSDQPNKNSQSIIFKVSLIFYDILQIF